MTTRPADFTNGPQQKQYLAGAASLSPPPPPIKVGASFDALDWLTGVYQADQSLFPTPEVTNLTIRHRRLAHVSDRITKMTVSLSTQLQSQVTVEVEDPDFRLLRTGILQGQPVMTYKGLQLELAGVGTIDRGRGALTLKARSAKVQALKRRRGPLTVIGDERSFIGYECSKVGLPFVTPTETVLDTLGPQYAKRISRDWQPYTQNVSDFDEIPSSWTTFKRLADQRGWQLFEANNVLYFAPMSWLFMNASMVRVRYAGTEGIRQQAWRPAEVDRKTRAVVVDSTTGAQYWRTLVATGDFDPGVIECISVPAFDHSQDRIETTVSFRVAVKDVLHFMPGKVIDFHGVPYFDGLYLCTGVDYDVTGTDATITAQTPVDPQPQGSSTFGGFAGGSSTLNGVGSDLTGSSSDKLGLPACGITMKSFLKGMRIVESTNNYKSPPSSPDGASGAYQYIGTTWRGVAPAAAAKRYPQAYLAPPDLQDQVAQQEVTDALRTYDQDWGKVAAHHFYPATAGRPHLWKYRPYMEPGATPPPHYNPLSNPPVIDYVRNVLRKSNGVACAQYDSFGGKTKLVTDMVNVALGEVGKPYEQTTAIDYEHDANPARFDCSSLVQWACARVGVTDMPRNSGDQWDHCSSNEIAVADALKMRGALLWVDGGGREGGEHVAISMGTGHSELAAHTSHAPLAQQINVRSTTASEWSRAALIPGMTYPPPKPH